jgi:hypothetical protein
MKTLSRSQDAAEIRTRILKLNKLDQPRWGVMNAPQMICHLRVPFRDALSTEPLTRKKLLLPAPLLKLISLRLPLPWPKNVPTLANYRVGSPGIAPTEFAADHVALLAAFDAFCAHPAIVGDHAFFGRMSHRDWMRWGYLHPDHHLRQFGR